MENMENIIYIPLDDISDFIKDRLKESDEVSVSEKLIDWGEAMQLAKKHRLYCMYSWGDGKYFFRKCGFDYDSLGLTYKQVR